MNKPKCLDVLFTLASHVDTINYNLIDFMTSNDTNYSMVCIRPDITYEKFYENLKNNWEKVVNESMNQGCNGFNSVKEFIELNNKINNAENLEDLFLDSLVSYITKPRINKFIVDENLINSMINLLNFIRHNCACEIPDLFRYISIQYIEEYKKQLTGLSKEDIKMKLKTEMNKFKTQLELTEKSDLETQKSNVEKKIINKLTNLYDFSMESELDTLIPDSLGSLKSFFIKVISTYYNNLHPVIWTQIYKQMINNIFIELPFSEHDWFSFSSKHVLLNSGPFILKILQMIRPVLTPELATKYNLTKLTYPKLNNQQISLILNKIVSNYHMLKINANVSASVGHVCIANYTNRPNDVFIIKIIKPLSIVQSCWEFKTLHKLFPGGSCENDFVRNMIESNGKELNVKGEIKNLELGNQYYTGSYLDTIGIDVNAMLTTVVNRNDVINNPNCWFALSMTLAPGVPLSYLVENDLLEKDTQYRAKLHRCLDILIYKFFSTLIFEGFYHGDLHAGNIFFSFDDSQMTLIDFGAVGEIDLFKNDKNIKDLLEIIIMSVYYNYDGMFDKMTSMLNDKCGTDDKINMESQLYYDMKQKLKEIKMHNIKYTSLEKGNTEEYKKGIFSNKRILDESDYKYTPKVKTFVPRDSIYSFLEYEKPENKNVNLNDTELPQFTKSKKPVLIGFSKILESIFTYYASNGTNVAIKLSEFYELQKAYALLLGVLSKVNYSPFRSNMIIRKSIMRWELLYKLHHISTVKTVLELYWRENGIYKNVSKNQNEFI